MNARPYVKVYPAYKWNGERAVRNGIVYIGRCPLHNGFCTQTSDLGSAMDWCRKHVGAQHV